MKLMQEIRSAKYKLNIPNMLSKSAGASTGLTMEGGECVLSVLDLVGHTC
jgi:hypothetical protein